MKIVVIQNKWCENVEEGFCQIADKTAELLKNKDIEIERTFIWL